jgi:hypothetical protein
MPIDHLSRSLRGYSGGYSNKEIAVQMKLSIKTVENLQDVFVGETPPQEPHGHRPLRGKTRLAR